MPLFSLSFLSHHFFQRLSPVKLTISLVTLCLYCSLSLSVFADTVKPNDINKNINDIQLKFSQFSANEGLSSSNVFAINQDKQGYLWVATEDGLNRFDGKKFQPYRHDISDSNSISDNVIRKIFIDNQNTLWVGTQNGLSRYNRELDNFDNFYHNKNDKDSLKDNVIWDVYQDYNDAIWVSTSAGVQTIVVTDKELPQTNESQKLAFSSFKIKGFDNELTEVKTIFQDQQGNYWFGSYDQGIHLVNSNFFYIGSLKTQNKYNLHVDANTLFDIKEIDGKIWLATDNGLYIIDHHYNLTSHISMKEVKHSTPKGNIKNSTASLLSNHIRSIEKYDDNNIWIATNQGLNIINLANASISSHQKNAYSTSLSDNWVMDIFRDKNGTMWIGSYGGGLNKYSPLSAMLYHALADMDNISKHNYRVQSFTEFDDGSVYLSTEQQGVFKVQSKKSTKVDIPLDDNIMRILSNKKNILWLFTEQGGLFSYNLLTNSLTKKDRWFNQAKYSINTLVFYQNNNIWFINQDSSLTKFNPSTQGFTHFPHESDIGFMNIQTDEGEMLWLVRNDNKIVSFNTLNEKFTSFQADFSQTFNNYHVTSFSVSNDYLWLGSDSQGIISINKRSAISTLFNEKNGLKNNYIASILVDSHENSWVATNKGLSVISPKTQKILHFDSDFAINAPEFIGNSALKGKNNQLYFGSPKGFYQFSPSELLSIKQDIAQPLFSNLYIANKKIQISKKNDLLESASPSTKSAYTLHKQLNSLNQVTLEHSHSPVSFEFVSPNTKLPHQLSYHYRLIGLEEEWVEADKNNLKATYTNLAPGDYTFEVQAYDLQSFEESSTSRLKVLIQPPWWLTNGAISVYLLMSLLFISFVFQQVRHRRLYHLQIKQNEERLKLSLWGSGDEMWDWNMLSGKVFRSNIWGKLEFPQDGSRNTSPNNQQKTNETPQKSNIHQHDIDKVKYALEQHTLGLSDHYEAAYRVQDKDGSWIWVLDRGKIVECDENQKPTRMTGTLKDISQIKNTEERLKLFAKCIENISDAVVIYDKQFIAVDVNKAFVKITGKTRELMLGKPLAFQQYPIEFCRNIKQHLITKGRWHGEIESLHHDNKKYFTDLNIDVIYDEDGSISHYVSVFSDITKRKSTEGELRRLASSDTLTGLPNRTFFQVHQAKLVKGRIPHALLVFDLDNFKKINDSLGHQVGDAILCKIAERIVHIGRKQDSVYRLGGDEFSIIIENTNDIHTITSISNDVLKTIAMPFKLKSQEIVLFSSIGIVLYPDDGVGPHELLKNADTAMYHAKNAGGNRYQFFNESMNKEAVHRLQVETLIRHGLREDSFSVFYQPKISISTGQIAGMEALVRFETPAKGIISPAVFIPVSEETGQIIDIGEIVLRKACFATKKWVDAGLFKGRVAVNLSAVQFTQANLVDLIANILKESKLPAKYLELEITEGTVMDAPQKAIETMKQIRAMGIHLSLDDFGTGYSSLAYLKRFPLNTLKIDKAFVDDIEVSEQGRNMVATIVTIAHNLEMEVVAEGVETNQQLDFLATLGCEQLQGYLYSKPLPTDNFHQYLISHKVTNQSTSFSQSY